jgi:hypothetical protein
MQISFPTKVLKREKKIIVIDPTDHTKVKAESPPVLPIKVVS